VSYFLLEPIANHLALMELAFYWECLYPIAYAMTGAVREYLMKKSMVFHFFDACNSSN